MVDPGRFTYSEEPPNLRRWFKGTAAHNTVCVDGLDQTPYRRGRPHGPGGDRAAARPRARRGLDLLAGEAVSPAYEAVHERRIAFVDGAYWVVEDRLRGERAHRYDLRFHLAPEAQAPRASTAATVLAPGPGARRPRRRRARARARLGRAELRRRLEAPVVSAVVDGRGGRRS